MRIIVTGALGSLGSVVTKTLAQEGHTVIATGRAIKPPDKLLQSATYMQADITKKHTLPDADICIHTAALSDDKAHLKDLIHANVTGTENTIQAAKNCNTFIHVSSSSVYLPSHNPLKEDCAGKQNNKLLSPYGLSKLYAENIVHETANFQSCFILRPRALYGPGDKMILPRVFKLEKNGVLQTPGDMNIKISMTHYKNFFNAINLCLRSHKAGMYTYNVADDTTYTFINVIREITKKLYHKDLPEKQIPIVILKFLSWFKINGITPLLVRSFTQDMTLDISKIKTELNYESVINLESSLNDLSKWVESVGGIEILKKGDKSLPWKF